MQQTKPDLTNIMRCVECLKDGYLMEVSGCSEEHLYGMSCCFKYICRDYCIYKCSTCSEDNKILNDDMEIYNYFYDGYKCWNCHNENKIKCIYADDLRMMCDRYCKLVCIPDDIIINGIKP